MLQCRLCKDILGYNQPGFLADWTESVKSGAMEGERSRWFTNFCLSHKEAVVADKLTNLSRLMGGWKNNSEGGRKIKVGNWDTGGLNRVLSLKQGLEEEMGDEFQFFERIKKGEDEVLIPCEWLKN